MIVVFNLASNAWKWSVLWLPNSLKMKIVPRVVCFKRLPIFSVDQQLALAHSYSDYALIISTNICVLYTEQYTCSHWHSGAFATPMLFVFLTWPVILFLSKVNIWNVNCSRAVAFIFDPRTDVLVKVSTFLRQKMSRPEGDSNPQPSDSCWLL